MLGEINPELVSAFAAVSVSQLARDGSIRQAQQLGADYRSLLEIQQSKPQEAVIYQQCVNLQANTTSAIVVSVCLSVGRSRSLSLSVSLSLSLFRALSLCLCLPPPLHHTTTYTHTHTHTTILSFLFIACFFLFARYSCARYCSVSRQCVRSRAIMHVHPPGT